MTSKRNMLGAGLMALALGLPALASAEQAPSALCDGAKAEKAPMDQRAEQDADKSQKKPDEKRDGKSHDAHDANDKRDQSGKTS